jgi:hypothetical protein
VIFVPHGGVTAVVAVGVVVFGMQRVSRHDGGPFCLASFGCVIHSALQYFNDVRIGE